MSQIVFTFLLFFCVTVACSLLFFVLAYRLNLLEQLGLSPKANHLDIAESIFDLDESEDIHEVIFIGGDKVQLAFTVSDKRVMMWKDFHGSKFGDLNAGLSDESADDSESFVKRPSSSTSGQSAVYPNLVCT